MLRRSSNAALSMFASAALALTGCSFGEASGGQAPGTGASADTRACISDFDPDTDYFPDKSVLLDARNFTIEYHRSYQVLTVHQPYPGGAPESYVLLRCGAPEPDLTGDLATATLVTTPITSLYSASTTHLPLVTELDRLDVLTGVASAGFVSDTAVRERIDEGRIVEYAPGNTVNAEKVVEANPEVLMSAGTDDPSYAKLRAAGIPVIANAEYLEPTALGRAEWIKVMAALTGTEARADVAYTQIRSRYLDVAAKAQNADPSPVLLGTMYEGTWSMPTGGTYAGGLITDAGGSYPWQDDPSTTGLPLNFETVFTRLGSVPTWLVTSDWATTADALEEDPRYGELAAVGDGAVWSATEAVGPTGGNDYYERGVTRPDLVLADIVAILHPELMPDHEFVFYRRVPQA